MSRILITRPLLASENLAAALQKLGYETVIEPLLSIEPIAEPCPGIDAIDAVIITSNNALRMLEGRQSELAALFDRPCFCVGPRTAEKVQAFGFRKVQNSSGDGAELAALANAVLGRSRTNILHIAGRDVDSKAQYELEKAGHQLLSWLVYDAKPVSHFMPATQALLKNHKFDAVLIFSPRTAQILAGLLKEAALEACCNGLAAICLSEAVMDVLTPFRWRHLVAAPKPAEDVVIACLQKLCPVKS